MKRIVIRSDTGYSVSIETGAPEIRRPNIRPLNSLQARLNYRTDFAVIWYRDRLDNEKGENFVFPRKSAI